MTAYSHIPQFVVPHGHNKDPLVTHVGSNSSAGRRIRFDRGSKFEEELSMGRGAW